MGDFGERYVQRAERKAAAADARYPLSAGQHILHLLLTVLTFGLWAPVWVVRAVRGNRPYVPPGEYVIPRGSLKAGDVIRIEGGEMTIEPYGYDDDTGPAGPAPLA
jgi:hypothetical protein